MFNKQDVFLDGIFYSYLALENCFYKFWREFLIEVLKQDSDFKQNPAFFNLTLKARCIMRSVAEWFIFRSTTTT